MSPLFTSHNITVWDDRVRCGDREIGLEGFNSSEVSEQREPPKRMLPMFLLACGLGVFAVVRIGENFFDPWAWVAGFVGLILGLKSDVLAHSPPEVSYRISLNGIRGEREVIKHSDEKLVRQMNDAIQRAIAQRKSLES